MFERSQPSCLPTELYWPENHNQQVLNTSSARDCHVGLMLKYGQYEPKLEPQAQSNVKVRFYHYLNLQPLEFFLLIGI